MKGRATSLLDINAVAFQRVKRLHESYFVAKRTLSKFKGLHDRAREACWRRLLRIEEGHLG